MNELAVAFSSRLPADLRRQDGDDLAAELAALVAQARREAPGIELDPLAFVGHVAERVTFDVQGRPILASLHAGDLWIAFGCASGVRTAIAAFEVKFAPEIRDALRRSFDAGLAEDAELKLLDKLLGTTGEGPRIQSYGGRGGLGSWLRAAAVRMAIDVMRARREVPIDPTTLGDIDGGFDPLLAALKERYRDQFKIAFREAAAELTPRDRTLLRYRFVDDLSIDEIGTLYRVHRATVARWIAAIRESLFEATRSRLVTQLSITDSEADSVLRLIDSQLDISITGVMR